MRKITAKEALANTQLIAQRGLPARFTPYILASNGRGAQIEEGSIITVVETPRNYEGCGRCVKFTVGDNLVHHYAFWSDFKNHTLKP